MTFQKMKSFQVFGKGKAAVTDIDLPVPSTEEVLVKVLACGICKTDAKIFMKGHRDLTLPRILGHELVAEDSKTHQRYVVFPGKTCGTCSYCQARAENLCPSVEIFGFSREGGLAEFISVPKKALIPISSKLPPEVATLAEPLGCCVNALGQMKLAPNTELVIFGGGVMGLLAAFASIKNNIKPIIYDINPEVLEEISSVAKTLSISLSSTLPGTATAALIATANPTAIATALQIHFKQLTVCGAYGCTKKQMEQAIKWISASPDKLLFLVKDPILLEEVSETLSTIWKGSTQRTVVRP